MWNSRRWSGPVVAMLMLAACDQTPVEPIAQLDPQNDAVASEAVQDSWDLLTSSEEIQLAALESASDPAVDGLIVEAGDLVAVAMAAEQDGDPATALTLSSWAEQAYIEAVVATRGSGFAAQTVSNVELAVSRVEAAVSDSPGSIAARSSIDQARSLVDRAGVELSRGNDAAAVRDAIDASDRLRDVSPGDRAKHFVQLALRLLEKAKELAGPDAGPHIEHLIREAEAHCENAVRALENENWHAAVQQAQHCAANAREVIALLSGGIPDDRLEAHAIRIVGHAEDLFHRAVGLAGDDPIPEVKRALEEAGELLRQAQEALAQEEWRRAIGLARESAAISRRVIGFLTHDRPGDGLQERAEHAVEHAKDLFSRAVGLAGDPPRPEIAAYLAEARELIAQADAALAEQSWRRAIEKAHGAARILVHVIRLLS